MPSDLSIEHWLDSIHMKDYFPLFMGYEEIDSLFHLKDHDLEKLGVRRAADRQKMLKSLATLMDTAYPGRERTGSRATALRRGSRSGLQTSVEEPQKISRSNSFKAKVGDFFKGITKGKRSGGEESRLAERPPVPIDNRHLSPGLTVNTQTGNISPASSTHSIDDAETYLNAQPWFHGMIMRKVADRALSADGDFLVRESISKPGEHVLTAKWGGKTLHFVINVVRSATVSGGGGSLSSREGSPFHNHINTSTGSLNVGAMNRQPFEKALYRFEKDVFPSIVELINFYEGNQKPISGRSGCVLKRAVPREITSHRPPSPLADHKMNSEPGTPVSKSSLRKTLSTQNGSTDHVEPVPENLSPVCQLDPELQRHLPDLDYARMMCATVLNTVSDELARHLTRVDLCAAELLEGDWDDKEGSTSGSMRKKGKRSSVGSAGGIAGLAAANLPQGKELGRMLLERFHNVSMWAAAVVVGAGDIAKRKNALKKIIEMAHHLQSDGLVNLHSFMAVMRGLELPQVVRLKQTWGLLRRNDASTVKSYEQKLQPTAVAVAGGNPHMHSVVCLPYLEPMLEMLQKTPENVDSPSAWEADQDVFALDALNNHLYNCRSLAISCPMYSDAGSKRLHGHKVIRDLHTYFKSDWQHNLLSSTMIKTNNFNEKIEKFQIMLTALSEYAEPSQG